MPDHLEIERKFEADASFVLPSLTDLPGAGSVAPPEVHQLDATYFDTADLALHRNKITLRRRTGGPDEGWHLKLPGTAAAGAQLPAGVSSRLEVHAPLDAGTAAAVPAVLAARVAEVAGGLPLKPIAT